MTDTAIGDYAMLSDRHSAALVARDGSVDWLCCPRFDSPSIFGRLLGDEAGRWSLRASGAVAVARRLSIAAWCWKRPSEQRRASPLWLMGWSPETATGATTSGGEPLTCWCA